MTARRLQMLSVGLGLVLLVMVGGIVALAILEPPTAVVPTPTATASPSPGTTPTSDSSPEPIVTPSPPVEPTPTTSPVDGATPPPGATPSPAVSPTTPAPAAPEREVVFAGLGLDSARHPEEEVTPRYFTFGVDGPGRISAYISDATGRVRACLWRGDTQLVADRACQNIRRGNVRRDIAASSAERWTLSLIGSEGGVSPSLTLRLRFPSNDAALRLEGFRFQGTDIDNYNGFVAEIRAAVDGSVRVIASFDDGEGGAHPYRLIVEEVGGGPAQPFLEEGVGQSFDASTDAATERRYRITLENSQRIADQRILLNADLDWP